MSAGLFDNVPIPGTHKVECPTCKTPIEPDGKCWRCTPDAEPALTRSGDPQTSKEAAAKVDTNNLETLVLLKLQSKGAHGATTKELELMTGIARVSVSPRMRPLAKKKLIRQTNEKREGCFVWVYTGDE